MNKPLLATLAFAAVALPSAYGIARHHLAPPPVSVDRAPELVGGPWLNTEDGKPVTLESRRGKPTLVAFWTFACSNCQANIAPYARLLKKYRAKGVELISIHTPELAIEHDVKQVASHVKEDKIDYPVLIDNASENWKRWHVDVWPALYVVDGNGIIRYHWFGELNWNNGGGEAKIGEVLDSLLSAQ